MSEIEGKKLEKRHIADWPWSVIVSVFGLVLLGVAYSSSDAYYNRLLDLFWIDSKAFPIDKAAHLTLSVWSTLSAVVGVLSWLDRNKGFIVFIVLLVLVTVALWMLIDYANIRVQAWKKTKQSVRRRSLIWRAFISYVPVAGLFLLLIVCSGLLVIFLSMFISIPAGIGEATAENVAAKLKRDFDLGCDKSKERCQILLKDGREVARGYVLVQSASRIAIYYSGGTRQIPLEGIEIRTVDRSPPR
ncbi:hypothetical protein [Burkholderia gladioli]|uniref:hypothetical protein n=1 Tax=Burkholderia gladioli TaxID=28095 RepID=UPI000FD6DE9A|nr:hypothetical protein [Burkholderia gladioli]MBU9422594.1 hypothetical protein [Burkholderia gladioli]MDN8060030.1 hypothetical protein [Burkholderia gladioli]